MDACKRLTHRRDGQLQGEPGQVAGLLDGSRHQAGGDAYRQRQRRCHTPNHPLSPSARQPGSGLVVAGVPASRPYPGTYVRS